MARGPRPRLRAKGLRLRCAVPCARGAQGTAQAAP